MNENFTLDDFAGWARNAPRPPHWNNLYSMYSPLWDAVTTDPALMAIPLDDHLVHRGDGLFETCRCENGGIYRFDAHWRRLCDGAAAIGLALPCTRERLLEICAAAWRAARRAAGVDRALLRVFVSRGPGGHGASPAECPAPQLYVAFVKMGVPFPLAHPEGARIGVASVPAKPGMFARVKSVDYLPNVLMKAQALERGLDFVVGLDPDGAIAEAPTENWAALLDDGRLVAPRPDHILRGTTLARVWELAAADLARPDSRLRPFVAGLAREDVTPERARAAREMFILGTTPGVTPVVEFEGTPVGGGVPGPAGRILGEMLDADMRDPAQRVWLAPRP